LVGCENKDNLSKIESDLSDFNEYEDEITLLDFENFYFTVKGIKFENFATFGKYLSINPQPWEGHSIKNVLNLEGCNFKVEDGSKYNDFSLSFYDDGTNKEDKDVIVSEVFVYSDSNKPLNITFAQGIKFGNTVKEVLAKYGEPSSKSDDNGKIYRLTYENEDNWIEIELEFDNEILNGFRIRYDYDTYLDTITEEQ